MSEFGLPRYPQREGSSHDAKIQSVMVWAAVRETGRSPLPFVPSGVKLNSQRYIADILEVSQLPWAKKHFQGEPWSLQQESAPYHASKITQS